jgi:hypothetical protein
MFSYPKSTSHPETLFTSIDFMVYSGSAFDLRGVLQVRTVPVGRRALLLVFLMASTGVAAQRYPKPQAPLPACAERSYRLVPAGQPDSWRRSFAGETGYDASAPVVACGVAANAQPLACVDESGQPSSTGADCLGKAMSDYDASGTGRKAAISYATPLVYYSVARADLGACQVRRFTWRSIASDPYGGCGKVQVPASVQCVDYDTGVVADDARCDAALRPPSTVEVEDRSGCTVSIPTQIPKPVQQTPPPEPEAETKPEPPAVIDLGLCRYTSSGGGRYSCGGFENYAGSPAAPTPRDLCSGRLLAGSAGEADLNGGLDYQTPRAGVGWSVPPVIKSVPGAQCIVQWRSGYSNNGSTAGWVGAYYSGRPTGRQGGLFVAKN